MTDDDGRRWGTLAEVARAQGVSVDTIRRRMKRGELEARRQQTPQGFRWVAVMPEPTQDTAPDAPGSPRANDSAAQGVTVVERDREELVETLRHELELRNREIARLHEVVAAQANAIAQVTAALPATIAPSGPVEVEHPAARPETRENAPGRTTAPSQGSGHPNERQGRHRSFWDWIRGKQ